MGAETIRLLLKQIESDDDVVVEPETVVMDTQLIIRQSSMRGRRTVAMPSESQGANAVDKFT